MKFMQRIKMDNVIPLVILCSKEKKKKQGKSAIHKSVSVTYCENTILSKQHFVLQQNMTIFVCEESSGVFNYCWTGSRSSACLIVTNYDGRLLLVVNSDHRLLNSSRFWGSASSFSCQFWPSSAWRSFAFI